MSGNQNVEVLPNGVGVKRRRLRQFRYRHGSLRLPQECQQLRTATAR
jgi:hypothetical protein